VSFRPVQVCSKPLCPHLAWRDDGLWGCVRYRGEEEGGEPWCELRPFALCCCGTDVCCWRSSCRDDVYRPCGRRGHGLHGSAFEKEFVSFSCPLVIGG
jgi:hypothetical protein